jgi:hypothetical protein
MEGPVSVSLVILNLSYMRPATANSSRGTGSEAEANKQPKEIRPCFGFVRRVERESLYHQQSCLSRSEQDKVSYEKNVRCNVARIQK